MNRHPSNNQKCFTLILLMALSGFFFTLILFHNHEPFSNATIQSDETNIGNNVTMIPPTPAPSFTPTKEEVFIRSRMSSTEPHFRLFLHPSPDMVSDSFNGLGKWSECINHLKRIQSLLVKGKIESSKAVILDVGANIGTCSLLFASQGYKVYSFEPSKKNYDLFNMSLHSIDNAYLKDRVIFTPAGVTNLSLSDNISMIETEIHSEKGNMGNSVVGGVNVSQEMLSRLKSFPKSSYDVSKINLTSLDHVVKEHIHYMKIDCQGCELKAFQGAHNLLYTFEVDIVAFEYSPEWLRIQGSTPLDVLTLLDSLDYVLFRQDGALIQSLKEFDNQYATGSGFQDVVAVKKKLVSLFQGLQ